MILITKVPTSPQMPTTLSLFSILMSTNVPWIPLIAQAFQFLAVVPASIQYFNSPYTSWFGQLLLSMPSQNYLSKPHETPVTVAISNCNCNAVNAANAASCCLLKCAAWMYTKIKCGPWCTNQPLGSVKDRLMAMPCLLHNGPLRPGTISIHHFLCSKNGLIGHTIGK